MRGRGNTKLKRTHIIVKVERKHIISISTSKQRGTCSYVPGLANTGEPVHCPCPPPPEPAGSNYEIIFLILLSNAYVLVSVKNTFVFAFDQSKSLFEFFFLSKQVLYLAEGGGGGRALAKFGLSKQISSPESFCEVICAQQRYYQRSGRYYHFLPIPDS